MYHECTEHVEIDCHFVRKITLTDQKQIMWAVRTDGRLRDCKTTA